MNEEEKKVINIFIEKCNKNDESVEIKGISVGEEYRVINTVCKALNLIEKLQKENQELKNKIMEKELEIIGKEEYTKASMGEIIEQYYTANEECIPIQKVKGKIEEIQEEGYWLFTTDRDSDKCVEVLQELIEGSEE